MDAPARNYWREEFALIVVLLVFFCGIIGLAIRLPFDARLFPMVIGTAGILLTGLIVAVEVGRRRAAHSSAGATADGGVSARSSWLRFATALLSAPVFGLAFWLFGFFVASVAAMLLMPPLMGYANRKLILTVGAATVLVMALFFPYLVGVSLPHGIVGDWLIDRLRSM